MVATGNFEYYKTAPIFNVFRTRAAEEQKEQRISKFLDACAAPRKWKARDGKWVQMVNWTQPENGKFEMDTGYTLRAKELRDLYK